MRVIAVLSALLLVACGVQAIYQDQAGQYDWLQQYVGRVKLAQLVTRPRPRLYVATEAGVLAALSPADGTLLWRKVLAVDDAWTHMIALGNCVVTLSDAGRQLLAWDVDTGAALWAVAVASSLEPAGSVDLAAVGSQGVAVSVGGTIKAFDTAKGKLLWTADLAGGPVKLFPADSGGIWAASLGHSPSSAHISADGEVSQQASLAANGKQLSSKSVAGNEAGILALSEDGGSLCTTARGTTGSCQSLEALLPASADLQRARLVAGSCAGHAVLQVAGGAAVLALADGAAQLVKFVAGATASGCFRGPSPDAAPLVALATSGSAGLQLQVVSAADGSSVERQGSVASLAPQRVGGEAVHVAALFAAPAPGQSFRHLVVFKDDSLALVKDGGVAWTRLEELASVTDVLFTDLPAPTPENEAQWLAAQPSWRDSLRAEVLGLKLQASLLLNTELVKPHERRELERHKALTNDKLRPTRDADGFRKQAVVLTAGGKVLALHNGDGRVLWSVDFGPAAAPSKLAIWRVPHDVQHDIEVVAFAFGGEGTTATVINAHTGAVQHTLSSAGEAEDLLLVPQAAHDGTADQLVYALVPPGVGGTVRLLPDTPQAHAAFAAARPSLAFWRADEQAGSVSGFGFTESGAVEERWTSVLAPAGGSQRILAVAAHNPGEAVFSPARVMGSGEVKFKYLNPNALLVAVGVPGHASSQSEEPRLTMLLVDAVTGRVLFSQTHEGASGPVHAVLSENMATYHFWSVEAHRWQMASVELFDASPPTLRVSDLAFAETNTTSSSWDAPPLEVGSQSFLCRLPVVGLSVTRSARGNTAKQVMLLTQAGQVYLLDRRFLDPRRPIIPPGQKPTPEQAAEALPPYAPELPLSGSMFATLDREVKRLRGVAVEAAELESTMMMLAHGLDLFYTRLTPSRSFDMVPDDFPYALLVLILVSMSAATLVLSAMQQRGVVKAKWQ
ncbi:hypothetical protein D9Q98_001941 [Chlorella vulgaris]|uniref:ER membrane protein complex subunit 1 n=1 Tax=Chlorella vulgaris TaxID=3077 RepID=A0A9D4Z0F7_CHLVU|nr:hypothetical protein D9Q98_001941 [Chlorella vulgaris]